MEACFQELEKTAASNHRFYHHKPSEKDHSRIFDVGSQPAGNLATQRLLRLNAPSVGLETRQRNSSMYASYRGMDQGTRMAAPTLQGSCAGCAGGAKSCPKCEEEQTGATQQVASHNEDDVDVTSQCTMEIDGEDLATYQDPECNAFHAESNCNPDNGVYEILKIDDPCCSKGCTRKHEERHANDLGLCCMMLNDNILNKTAPRQELIQRYKDWMAAGARNWTECNAYGVSVRCALEEIKAKNCEKSDTQCCKELKFYLGWMKSEKNAYCDQAPETRPPCPFRPAPGPTP